MAEATIAIPAEAAVMIATEAVGAVEAHMLAAHVAATPASTSAMRRGKCGTADNDNGSCQDCLDHVDLLQAQPPLRTIPCE